MDYAPFPLIDLSGTPRERGRIHGKAAADRLRRGAKMYAESLLKSGVDWKELERRAEALVPGIEKFDPTYVEEMRGIAEGAGEPFAAVVLMNARTEMVAAARRQQATKHFPDGCTAAFALPEATGRTSSPSPRQAGSRARVSTRRASASPPMRWNAIATTSTAPACRCPSSAARCWRAPISPRR